MQNVCEDAVAAESDAISNGMKYTSIHSGTLANGLIIESHYQQCTFIQKLVMFMTHCILPPVGQWDLS